MRVPDPQHLSPSSAPDCLKCEHFAVSWDPKYPRSCKLFGVKTPMLPSHAVYRSTGRHCPAFSKSAKVKDGADKKGRSY